MGTQSTWGFQIPLKLAHALYRSKCTQLPPARPSSSIKFVSRLLPRSAPPPSRSTLAGRPGMAYVVIMCQGGFGMNTEAAESGRPHVDGDGNGVWLSGRHLLLVGRGSQGIDDHKRHPC